MALDFGKLDFAVAFNRQTAFPLDAKSYFESLESAQAAAQSADAAGSKTTTYYFGQQIAVVESGVATLYIIQPDKTLKEVGGKIDVNENIFQKTAEGKLDIIGFASAVAGAQAVKGADGKISWVKPDTTTVEGLTTTVTQLSNTVNGYTDGEGVVHEGLGAKVSTLETKVANTYTKAEVDSKVSSVMRYKGSKDTYADLPAEGNVIGDVWNIATADTAQGIKAGDNVAWNGTGWDILGGAVDLSGYATKTDLNSKVDKVEGSRLMTTAEGEKLANIEAGAQVNKIESVAAGELAISEDKELSIIAIAQNKITGLDTTLAGKVNVEAGKGLSSNDYTDDEKAKLGGIEANAQANILDVVKINGAALPIVEKAVDIPLATAEALGVIKGSTDENKIAVGADGTMEVNSLNVNKLTQTAGDTLILNGGTSKG